MDNTYSEFEGTEFDPSADLEFDDEQDDLVTILGISAVVAAVVGALLVLFGRRRNPTPQERAEEILSQATKRGRKGVKAASKAVERAQLGDLRGDAIEKARGAADGLDLGDNFGGISKKARRAVSGLDLGSLLEDATDRARKAASNLDVEDSARSFGKRASKVAASAREMDLDGKGLEGLLETLKERLSDAIDSVRSDIAPKATDRLKDDLLPAIGGVAEAVVKRVREDVVPVAEGAVSKVREDVLPTAQKRAGAISDEYEIGARAGKAASAAKESAMSLADVLRGVALTLMGRVVDDVLPGARKVGGQAVRTARADVLPKVGDIAQQAPEVLSDVLQSAMNKVEDALDAAQPAAADALEYGKHRAAEAAEFSMHRARDIASGVRGAGTGVGGAVSSAGRGVTDAVGSAVGATAYATRETTGILFWLSMLSGLVLLTWVPDKDKQKEIWNNALQFLGELREMWSDLQGVAEEPDSL
ncbi:MAG TPA: hypothetical protein VM409_00935 [Chloroflexia bacterium]|nr:hypothetical protein [Chloroflexia bacterium]